VFSRIFHALVGDSAPEGVDPALHRRALWWAFSICAWVYSASFLISLPLLWIDVPWNVGGPSLGLWRVLVYFDYIGPPWLFPALLVPPLIYAIVLRMNRTRVPLAVIDLTAVLAAAYILRYVVPVMLLAEPVILLLMMVVLHVRGHLQAGLPRALLRATIILFFLVGVIQSIAFLSVHAIENPEWVGFHQLSLAAQLIRSVCWLPLSVALPIALIAKPNTPRLRHANGKLWQLPILLLSAVLIAAAVNFTRLAAQVLGQRDSLSWFFSLEIIGGFRWMVMLVIIVLCWWLLKYGAASRDFLGFTVLTLVAIAVTSLLLPPVGMTHSARMLIPLLAGFLGGLLLAASHTFDNRALRAAAVIALGSMAVGTLYICCIERLAETFRQLVSASQQMSIVLKWIAIDLVALVAAVATLLFAWWFVKPEAAVATLLFAWWFVKPEEIEALLPWRRKREAESDVVSP